MPTMMQHPKHGRHPATGHEIENMKANGWTVCPPKVAATAPEAPQETLAPVAVETVAPVLESPPAPVLTAPAPKNEPVAAPKAKPPVKRRGPNKAKAK